MAVTGFRVGVEFGVLIAGVAYPFKTVSVKTKTNTVNRSNSKYFPGFDLKQRAIIGMTIECEGPYNSDEIPLAIGNSYIVQVTRWAGATVGSGVDQGTFILTACEWTGDQESGESNVRCVFENTVADFNTLLGA